MEIIEDAAGIRGREIIPRVIPITAPAVGADVSVIVPGGVVWRLKAFSTSFITSAAVANRSITLRVADSSANRIGIVSVTDTQAASLSFFYSWLDTAQASYTTSAIHKVAPLPCKTLLPGWQINTLTNNLDVGDSFVNVVIYVYEIWERPLDTELGYDLAKLRGSQSNAFPLLREDW